MKILLSLAFLFYFTSCSIIDKSPDSIEAIAEKVMKSGEGVSIEIKPANK